MMRDHGFVIGATRIWKRVWQLYLAHVVLFVIYVAAVGYVALRFQFDNIIHEFQRGLAGRASLRDLDLCPAARFQAGQSGCAAALYRPHGTVSLRAVDHAAASEPYAARLFALRRGASIWLESPCLSGRDLVLQSILLAIHVLLGELVCPGRGWKLWPLIASRPFVWFGLVIFCSHWS